MTGLNRALYMATQRGYHLCFGSAPVVDIPGVTKASDERP